MRIIKGFLAIFGIMVIMSPVLLILGVFIAAIFSSETKELIVLDDECRSDSVCVYDYINQDLAAVKCESKIEDLARFDYEWEGILTPRFDRGLFQGDDVFRIFGDAIKFQNGFGAFERHKYYCDWDITEKVVLGVYAEPLY